MNKNGLAVLLGIILMVVGMLNQVNDYSRFMVSVMLLIAGLIIVLIGIKSDRIG